MLIADDELPMPAKKQYSEVTATRAIISRGARGSAGASPSRIFFGSQHGSKLSIDDEQND